MSNHETYMQMALELADTNLGQTWPNPTVGAVLVKDGAVIGKGATGRGGRPHAETEAIAHAAIHNGGADARGATLYVTLEPCSHQGETGPCVDMIIAAGITHVVVATRDPNPKVNGQGIAKLLAAGITVEEGVLGPQAEAVNCGFFSVINRGRPYVALKLATSLDGKMATRSGQSQWITGESAREYTHRLRSRYDALITGVGTVFADNPQMTVRIPGLESRSPVRVVLDRNGRMPRNARIMQQQEVAPTWVLTDATVTDAVNTLMGKGITRIMVEAGAGVGSDFLQSGLVDKIYWFRAPIIIGEEGLSAFDGSMPDELAKLARFAPVQHSVFADDSLDVYLCSPES